MFSVWAYFRWSRPDMLRSGGVGIESRDVLGTRGIHICQHSFAKMANSVTVSSLGLLGYGIVPKTSIANQRRETYASGSSSKFFQIRAVQDNEGPRRLVDIIRIIPEASRNYFRSPSRRALFGEYVTRFYYSRPKVTFPIALLNNFKMGFTYGLFIDAFKLAS
ncbi:uncharacterized protein [Primulina huaijiensis]|uniref:uncharacterized protein isoform X3 n=1 Tax=Primulina huaijiensis TaxID=1492673 RepID=UPI003CC77ADD